MKRFIVKHITRFDYTNADNFNQAFENELNNIAANYILHTSSGEGNDTESDRIYTNGGYRIIFEIIPEIIVLETGRKFK